MAHCIVFTNCASSTGRCTVSSPTITTTATSSSNMDTDVCHMVSQGSLSYTCTINGSCLFWNSSLFSPFNLVATVNPHETRTVNGRNFTVTHNGNETCLVSIMLINASLVSLTQLNRSSIRCSSCDKASVSTVTIIVPGTYNVTCMHGNE